jgi:hypothetical protein
MRNVGYISTSVLKSAVTTDALRISPQVAFLWKKYYGSLFKSLM